VLGNAAAKRAQRQERHELRENKLAVVHASPLREDAKDHKSSPLQNPCKPHECLFSGVNPDVQNSQIDIQ